MRSFIFSSYRPEDTKRLGSTIEVEHSHVRFPGNLVLNLWDCGGQTSYMENYMTAQRNQVFSSVCALVYVVDVVGTDVDGGSDASEWETVLRVFLDSLSLCKHIRLMLRFFVCCTRWTLLSHLDGRIST